MFHSDILSVILSYGTLRDRCIARYVCKQWKNVSESIPLSDYVRVHQYSRCPFTCPLSIITWDTIPSVTSITSLIIESPDDVTSLLLNCKLPNLSSLSVHKAKIVRIDTLTHLSMETKKCRELCMLTNLRSLCTKARDIEQLPYLQLERLTLLVTPTDSSAWHTLTHLTRLYIRCVPSYPLPKTLRELDVISRHTDFSPYTSLRKLTTIHTDYLPESLVDYTCKHTGDLSKYKIERLTCPACDYHDLPTTLTHLKVGRVMQYPTTLLSLSIKTDLGTYPKRLTRLSIGEITKVKSGAAEKLLLLTNLRRLKFKYISYPEYVILERLTVLTCLQYVTIGKYTYHSLESATRNMQRYFLK